jgi:peptidoglycan/LPS O-acetylase OafA/YrhL
MTFSTHERVVATSETTARSLIRPYYPALDGLRGVAILMVFFSHYGMFLANPKIFKVMWVGVDLFFVLSGFLITGILYDSKARPRYFRDFYIRRSLRIFPLYYGFFLVVGLLWKVLRLHADRVVWTHLFYGANLFMTHIATSNPTAIHVGPFHGQQMTLWLGALWSLCVEEQFYLVWPLVIRLLPSRRVMMWFCGAGVLAVMSLRCFLLVRHPALEFGTSYLYYATYARCDTLLLGSWLALWLRGVTLDPSQIRKITYPLIAVCGVVLSGGYLLFGGRWNVRLESNPMVCGYGYTLIGLMATGVLLLALDESSVVHRALRNKRLAALGVLSYGFYFFHGIPWPSANFFNIHIFAPRHLSALLVPIYFGLAYLLAWLSFRYFESPFLRLKNRWAPGHRSVPSGREDVSPMALVEE